MRIRKRYQNPLLPADLSSSLAQSTAVAAAAAVAPPAAAAGGETGGKGGEAVAAAAAANALGGGCGGGGGKGLHLSNNPNPCPPFYPPPPAGVERGDPPPPEPALLTRDVLFAHGHIWEVPQQEQERGSGTDIGDANGRWSTGPHCCGGNTTASKSLGAEASEAPVGHGEHKMLLSDATALLAEAGAMARCSDEEGEFPPKKRGGYHAQGRNLRHQEEEDDVVAERETKPRPRNTRRRHAAAFITTTTAATEEGGDMMPSAAMLAGGNRGVGNVKKRRSPAVLMEGSRCSRVNGRGWRCCQQTLVGYSLCEHHLGKGRLRSVSSVRCNARARKKEDADDGAAPPPPSLLRQQDQLLRGDAEDEEEEEKPSERRRRRIGMVKARSISSLLHQSPHQTTTIAAPAPLPSPSPAPPTGQVITPAAAPPHATDTAVAYVNQCK